MNKKYNLLIVILGTLVLLVGMIMQYLAFFEQMYQYEKFGKTCFNLGALSCLAVLISHNDFWKTVYAIATLISVLLIMLVGLFNMMDWPGVEALAITGFSGVIASYSWRFFKKTNKYHLDYLKWVWVLIFFPAGMGIMFDHGFAPVLYLVSTIVYVVLLADYILFARGEGLLVKQNDAAE